MPTEKIATRFARGRMSVIDTLTKPVRVQKWLFKDHDWGNGPGVAEQREYYAIDGHRPSWRFDNISIGTNGYQLLVEEFYITPQRIECCKITKFFNNESEARKFASDVKGTVYWPPLWGENRFFVQYVVDSWYCVCLPNGEVLPLYLKKDLSRSSMYGILK